MRYLIKDPFHSDLKISKVTQPKLFIHGRRDNIIPLSSGEALFRAAPEPKQMLIYDGAGHNDIWDDRIVGDVIRFVEAHAQAPGNQTRTAYPWPK